METIQSKTEELAYTLSHERDEHGHFVPVLEDLKDWPIYRLGKSRDTFVPKLIERSIEQAHLMSGTPQKLHDQIAQALYLERIRIKHDPYKVDPPDDKKFWKSMNERLVKSSLQNANGEVLEADAEMLSSIISRYAHEIAGNFNPKTYRFASKVLPMGFNRFLNAANTKRFWSGKFGIRDRIKLTGPMEHVRELSQKGTILLTPTHFSNLDSVLIGWTLHQLGLPAFLYGAGLNLFNGQFFKYFMNGLGAYRVDRRKKNRLYIETLKMYSRMTLRDGCHSLFFPGGTRARDGQLEKRLKLGLLSTAIDAQRECFTHPNGRQLTNPNAENNRIYVVPMVINYHFVLEAGGLIHQFLEKQGKDKYYIDKEIFPSRKAVLQFMQKFVGAKSEIFLSLGDPMDVFGNKVDLAGNSIDRNGNTIDISNYFKTNGEFKTDLQRDSEYTKLLSERIIDAFYKKNTVLSSHLVAYTAFNLLFRKHRRLDQYGVLRLPEDERKIPYAQFAQVVERLRDALKVMAANGEVQLANHMHGDIDRLIQHGIYNLGVYHAKHPLVKTDSGDISSEDMNLLFYYHNRLKGYDLQSYI